MTHRVGIAVLHPSEDPRLEKAKEIFATSNYPVIYLEEKENLQIGKIYNRALDELDSKYVLYVRTHIAVKDLGWIDLLADSLDADNTRLAVAPMILDKETGNIAHTGIVFCRGEAVSADVGVPIGWHDTGTAKEFLALHDDCMLIRRFDRFRENFFTGQAEIDWFLRARKYGMVGWYEASVAIPMYSPPGRVVHREDYIKLLENHGGFEGLDAHNNSATYYGSGQPRPATEHWKHEKLDKGTITVFLGDHSGCGTYRLKYPYRQLINRGWDVIFTHLMDNCFIDIADIVVVQRACHPHMLDFINYARSKGKKVIYEIDDFFHGLPLSNPAIRDYGNHPDWLRNMEKMIYLSDALVVSTPELKKQYGRFNTNTHVVPNHMDLQAITNDQPMLTNEGDRIRIGWGGTSTHDQDIVEVISAVERVMSEHPETDLVFLGADYRSLFKIPYERMHWYPGTFHHEDPVMDYMKILNRSTLDIGLAPIADVPFNRNKSDLKCLEYGTYGIATIASEVEPYVLCAKDCKEKMGEQGYLLARLEKDWYRHLKRLVQEPETRQKLGSVAQGYIWNHRGLDKMAEMIEKVIKSAYERPHIPIKEEPPHSLAVTFFNNMTSKAVLELALEKGLITV